MYVLGLFLDMYFLTHLLFVCVFNRIPIKKIGPIIMWTCACGL